MNDATRDGQGDYLDTLLLYYEEEIMGEGYFFALARHHAGPAAERLMLLAAVERRAAEAVRPLLDRHGLVPRDDETLLALGEASAGRDSEATWQTFIADVKDNYGKYLVDFAALEAMAPPEDLGALRRLTEHEVVTIDFAEREAAGDPDSTAPLRTYLES